VDNNRNSIYDRLDCREISAKNSKAEAAPKNVCSKKQVFGQTILEQPLPKNLKAKISNTILRLFIY